MGLVEGGPAAAEGPPPGGALAFALATSAALAGATGCSNLLGLDDPQLADAGTGDVDAPDAPIDGPDIDAPANMVTGRSYNRFMTATGVTEQPIDLSASVIQALIPDGNEPTGFRTATGSGGTDGTFTINDVPDGVTYTLRFGEIAAGQGLAMTAGTGSAAAADAAGENRYLMITAAFDPSLFPEPAKAANRSFADKPDSLLTLDERKQKDIDAVHSRWLARISAGQKRADDLNTRFAKWYYVISSESFDNLHLKRTDVLRDKQKQS